MNIKFILSRLSACAIAVALSTNTANAKVIDTGVRVVTKRFTKVEPVQPAFEEIVKAAGNGNSDMQLELGWRYFNGTDTETNFVKAAECFQKAAAQGNREAQFNIGAMYAEGIGVEENWTEAAAWLTKAAAQGHAKAKANLCVMYAEGIGVEKNSAEAEKYLNDAVFVGREPEVQVLPFYTSSETDRVSQDELIWRFNFFRNNVLFEHPISKQWIHKLAERGHVEAAIHLGDDCYEQRNWKEAVKWYRAAAEKMGNTSRYYVRMFSRIGFIYDEGGYGVEEDNAEAIKWYTKAVGIDKSNASALRLADMYFDGEGVNKDPRMAVNLLYQILFKDSDVCRRLARCYIDGEGVPENMFMAAIWWLKAEGQIFYFAVLGIIAIGGSIIIVSICFAIGSIKKIFS